MMKRFIAIISVLMAVLTVSAAFAVVQDFGEYTVDVIDGWTAVRQGETVYFVKNDNSASWSVMISELPGNATLEQYAKDVMKQLKGSDFKFDGRSYSFKFTAKKSSGNTANIVKTLSTKYFTFAVPRGWDGYEIDEFYAKEHKAKDLEKKNGTYSFTYEEDGKLNVATLGIDKQVYILIIQTAKDKAGFN